MKANPHSLRPLALLLAGFGSALVSVAQGETVFTQDFENGLGPNESTFGSFSINDTLTSLNNGTLMMGHASSYGPLGGGATPLPSYSYYDLVLDLRGFVDAELRFDFNGAIEKDFDGFNVLATTERKFSPPAGLLTPTAGSGLQYGSLTIHGASSPELGPIAWSSPADPAVVVKDLEAIFDLSDFDDQKVRLRFQFGTDALEGGEGANFDNIVVEATALPDSDGDGMPDSFEDSVPGLDKDTDDSSLDLDGDGVDNITEFENCTDPGDEDTDDDGLSDLVETNTGVYVSATDTGTDPNFADTDEDGLLDGVENNSASFQGAAMTGTDPHNPDTDGDNILDGDEVAKGSNPLDGSDLPPVDYETDLVAYWHFDGGDLTNQVQDNYHGMEDGPAISYDPGLFEEAAHLDGSQSIVIENSGVDFAFVGQSLSVSAWFTADVIDTSWQCLIAKGEGNSWRMHRRGGDNPPEMAWTGGNGDTPKNNVPISIGNPETWHHVVGVTDTERNVEVLYLDGESIAEKDLGGGLVQNSTQPARIGENPDARNRRWKGKIDDVAIWNRALEETEVLTLYSEGLAGNSLGAVMAGPAGDPFALHVQRSGQELEISWDSRGGELYNLRSAADPSSDPLTWDIFDSNQDIAATPPRNTLTIPYPADPTRFFVIEGFPTPPLSVFSDDFESGQGAWTTGSIVAATATEWELGTPDPTVSVGPAAAHSGANCFGTDLDGQYAEDTEIYLRSPAIDLSTVVDATLTYWQFFDIEPMFDSGSIWVLDAADDSEIAVLEEGIEGTSSEWEEVSLDLPPEAIGRSVKIEFRFMADDFNSQGQAGFYIDDVSVEGSGL